ncbi:hypothetical protein [Leifsonia aquatica]|uniref:hypothetical protein n=1 Tax=Leifsonia aquatica TaxID=144185 RepID=UPI0037F4C47F
MRTATTAAAAVLTMAGMIGFGPTLAASAAEPLPGTPSPAVQGAAGAASDEDSPADTPAEEPTDVPTDVPTDTPTEEPTVEPTTPPAADSDLPSTTDGQNQDPGPAAGRRDGSTSSHNTNGPQLASTGSDTTGTIVASAIAAALLVGGGVSLTVARRRRPAAE